jgi:hypothetical protein
MASLTVLNHDLEISASDLSGAAPPAGYTLANAGKDTRSIQVYLGHKDIRHTVRYAELSPTRLKNFFPD